MPPRTIGQSRKSEWLEVTTSKQTKYKSDKLSVITKFTSAQLENSFHYQELGRSLTPSISVHLNIQELFQDKALYLLWIILCRVFFLFNAQFTVQ